MGRKKRHRINKEEVSKQSHSNKRAGESGLSPHASLQDESFLHEEKNAIQELYTDVKNLWPLLLFFLGFATLLRFYQFTEPSMWMDEIVTYEETLNEAYNTVSYSAHWIHLELVKFFMNIFGSSVFAYRFWSAFSAALAVPVLVLSAFRFFGRESCLFAGLFCVANPFLVLYAQEGNYYGGLQLYTALQILGLSLIFRKGVFTGLATVFTIAYISFYTHPMSILFSASCLFCTALYLILPDIRSDLITFKPSGWKRKPLFPVGIFVALAMTLIMSKNFGAVQSLLVNNFSFEGTKLTNIDFSFSMYTQHFYALLVNYYRFDGVGFLQLTLPVALLITSFFNSVSRFFLLKSRFSALLCVSGITMVIGSYLFLYLVKVERNFYIRYFIFMPVFLGVLMTGVFTADLKDGKESKVANSARKVSRILGVSYFAVMLYFTLSYLSADTSNYKGGVELLHSRLTEQDNIVSLTRNDRVAARFYLKKAGIAIEPPGYTYLDQPGYPDIYRLSPSVAFMQMGNSYLLSGWKYVDQSSTIEILRTTDSTLFRGHSRWDNNLDLEIFKWRDDTLLLLPGAALYPDRDLGPDQRVYAFSQSKEGKGIELLEEPSADVFLPESMEVRTWTPREMLNIPSHTLFSYDPETSSVRSERDGKYTFLVYSDGEPLDFQINAMPASESDPLWEKNAGEIKKERLDLGLFVNGELKTIKSIQSKDTLPQTIRTTLRLKKGNHLIDVAGLQVREGYTPYFPWYFQSMVVRSSEVYNDLTPDFEVAEGWGTRPSLAIARDMNNPRGWKIQGNNVAMEPDGDFLSLWDEPSIRIDISKDSSGFRLFGPVMPVEGKVAQWTFWYRMKAVESVEFTPSVIWLDASLRPMGGPRFLNGSNFKGTTFGDRWCWRYCLSAIPDGAEYMLPGLVAFPYKAEIPAAGTLWIGGVTSPGCDESIPLVEDYVGPNYIHPSGLVK